MENYNLILDINRLKKKMCINDAFFGLFASGLPVEDCKDIPLAAVSLNKATMDFKLLFNAEEFQKYDELIRFNLLSHELRHICYFHLLTQDMCPNHVQDNIATDVEINYHLGKKNLPSFGCFLEDMQIKYPQLDWSPNRGRKHYYDELSKLSDKEKKELGIDEKAKNIWIITNADGQPIDGNSLTEGEKNAIRVQLESTIEQIAEEVQKSQGHIPVEISQMVKGFVKPKPKFNYKKYIRNYIGNSTKYYIGTSRLRENARFPDSPKIVLKPLNRVLVLVDESGSVSENELLDFLNEIHHISKKNDIEIRPFDTDVMKAVKYDGKGVFKRTNCGGTSFTAAVDFYNKNKEFTSCLIFTDGHAEVPPKCSKRLLWVISSNGNVESIKSHAPYIKIPVD